MESKPGREKKKKLRGYEVRSGDSPVRGLGIWSVVSSWWEC